jgi:uncharacterized lipoprotein YddW (UPF0748 family)
MVPMIVLIYLAVVAVVVGVAAYAMRMKSRRETPEELRGDWWSRFEADFRAYARRWEIEHAPERHRGGPLRPSQRRDLAEGSF